MDALDVYRATLILLSDRPTGPVDALFFHGRASRDDDSLFELAQDLHRSGVVRNVVVNGSDGERVGGSVPGEAWPGGAEYVRRLGALGIESPVYTKPAFNTREENNAFLQVSMERGWRTGAILCQPHQALRAMLGMVKAMLEYEHLMRVYTVTPMSTLWWEQVYGSQGADFLPRFDHIEQEFLRIRFFQEAGVVARFDELFAYLRNRADIA